VSKCADLEKLVDTAVKRFGRLDIMVNNAGIETRTSVLNTSEAQYDKVMEVNLKSAFFGTQIAATQMIKQGGGGRIINITSVHEDWPMPGNTAYCLAKGALIVLTLIGVATAPGPTPTTRILWLASSRPAVRVSMRMPVRTSARISSAVTRHVAASFGSPRISASALARSRATQHISLEDT
jgi:glucose 1-dehydrogenase